MANKRITKRLILELSKSRKARKGGNVRDFERYIQLVSGFRVSQYVVDDLANSINRNWWTKNRAKLINR